MSRRIRFGKEVKDELVSRVLLETVIYHYVLGYHLMKISPETYKTMIYLRKVVSKFSLEEIQDLFSAFKEAGSDKELVILSVLAALEKKKIRVPRTEKELDEFLLKE